MLVQMSHEKEQNSPLLLPFETAFPTVCAKAPGNCIYLARTAALFCTSLKVFFSPFPTPCTGWKATPQRKRYMETFIDERYPGADDETRDTIKKSPAWQETEKPSADAKESRAIRNAVSFAAKINKRFRVPITFMDSIEGGAHGKYENRAIVIDKNTATQGEVIRRVMVHELTHRTENSKWYGKLRDALVDIGYGGDSEKLNADV